MNCARVITVMLLSVISDSSITLCVCVLGRSYAFVSELWQWHNILERVVLFVLVLVNSSCSKQSCHSTEHKQCIMHIYVIRDTSQFVWPGPPHIIVASLRSYWMHSNLKVLCEDPAFP